ncbi:MAG: general secretion pathway protein GspB, partial [Deltaproteobacteria bacterium]|nr:general secretion pathway protein GspB [Deltaproteobacteria bacterium]
PMQASEQNKASSRSYVEGYGQSEPLDPFAVMPKKSENDSGLRLQAIAWSEDPKQRMAVINNNIVREGGSVEGAAVTHIGEDMVVFKREGEEWKQLFRLR